MPPLRQTHTYAEMEISAAAYDEIAGKLKKADYGHAFMTGEDVNGHPTIDMHGLGLTRASPSFGEWMIGTKQATAKVLDAVRTIANLNTDQGETVDRATVKLLQLAWCDAVRAEWQAFVGADPELKAQHAVAVELMHEDGYTMEQEPICGLPGAKPAVAVVDGKEAVCLDHSMGQVTPLSAIYVNKVRIVQSAAARAAKALAEEAVKAPPEWPITIASGETFNSIEEMEASPIEAVKEMAKMMRDAPIIDTPNVRWHRPDTLRKSPTAQTCWEYFGFAGPVNFTELQGKYREIINSIASPGAAKLVPEVHRQYQNCLKELGTAIMEGKADAE